MKPPTTEAEFWIVVALVSAANTAILFAIGWLLFHNTARGQRGEGGR